MITWKAPQTKYDSFNEIGKFNMLWDVCIVLIPIFFALFVIHLYLGDLTWVTSLVACIIDVVCIIILNKTRKYKVVSIFITMVGVLMIQSLIYFIDDSQLISDVLWSVLLSYFGFFLFNSWVGTIILLVNISSMLIFNSFHGAVSIVKTVDAKMVIDVIYVSIALAYVINKMMQNNKFTNSLKHGLNAEEEGKIAIKITSEDEETRFDYSDTGQWKTPQNESSFGLELLTTLTEQLDGSFSRTTDDGTKYHFVFNTKTFFFDPEET